jgi:hypothetical protein
MKEMFELIDPEEVYLHAKEVYAEDAYFNDTLKELRGATAIANYLRKFLGKLSHWVLTIDDTVRSGDEYYLRWTMTYTLKLWGGRLITTTGITHLRFNEQGRVSYHRDYWDPISGLFEQLPIAGNVIRFLKRFV